MKPRKPHVAAVLTAIFAFVPMFSLRAASDPPKQDWVKLVAARKDVGRNGVAVDKEGNVYFTGGKANPSESESNEVAVGALVISKYTESGELKWYKEAKPARFEFAPTAIAVDSTENIFVAGSASESFTIDGIKIDIASRFIRNAFVLKFDPSGKLLWSEVITSAQESIAQALAVDQSGAAFVAGYFVTRAKLGEIELDNGPIQKGPTSFLAKYRANGGAEWARAANLTNIGYSFGSGVCVSLDEKIYTTGEFSGQADFGAVSLRTAGDEGRMFLACFDQKGAAIWARDAGGNGNSDVSGKAVAADRKGNLYAVGSYFGKVSFGSNTISAVGDQNVFLAKYAPDGTVKWVRSVIGNGWNEGQCVAVDLDDNAIIGGAFFEANRFASTTVVSRGISDAFVASYSPVGEFRWVKQFGGPGWDKAEAVSVHSPKQIYVTGSHAPGAFDSNQDALKGGEEEPTGVFLIKLSMP